MKNSCNQEFVRKGRGITSNLLTTAYKLLNKLPIGSVVNRVIDALPIELHVPGYQYCGPGTNLKSRIARGDPGINKLDQACKEHDLAYAKYSNSEDRSLADRILSNKAWERVKSTDASFGERATALAVAAAMKGKTAIGGGKRRRVKNKTVVKRGKGHKRRNTRKRRNSSLWQLLKKGKGLYLKPYPNVF